MSEPAREDTSSEPFALGLDIGGSSAKMGLVDRAGRIVARHRIPTPGCADPVVVADAYADGLRELLSHYEGIEAEPVGLGVGIPGHVSSDRRMSPYSNVHALDGFPLVDYLSAQLSLPVELDNDGTLAALAEYRYGAGQGVQRLLVVTIGTGIGVGLIVDGEPQRPIRGCLGDPGHLIVAPHSPIRCGCGCRGCLETVASSLAMERRAAEIVRQDPNSRLAQEATCEGAIPAAVVIQMAKQGDQQARGILHCTARWLGVGLASWCCLFDPDVILVGGGVSSAGEMVLPSARQEMARVGMPKYVHDVSVALASLGNDAGVIGAASLFSNPQMEPKS